MTSLPRRLMGAAVIGAFLLVAVILLLSDRAGTWFGGVVDLLLRVGGRAERYSGVDVVDRTDIPYRADDLVHAAFWACGTFVIGWIMRHRMLVPISALFVGGTSLLFEAAQPIFSATRSLEPSDALANLVGVSLGAIFLQLALWGLELLRHDKIA